MKAKILSITLLLSLASFANRPQSPVPLNDSSPSRVSVAAKTGIHRDNGAGSFGLANLLGVFNYNYYLGAGFEFGVGALGGVASEGMLFAGGDMASLGGAELMARYLGAVTDAFYMGVAVQVDYAHNFDAKRIKEIGSFDFGVSLPFTFEFGDRAAWLYLAPNFGLRDIRKSDDASSFGGLTADKTMAILVGTYIDIGGPSLMIEAQPRWNDVNKLNDIAVDFALGVVFDF